MARAGSLTVVGCWVSLSHGFAMKMSSFAGIYTFPNGGASCSIDNHLHVS